VANVAVGSLTRLLYGSHVKRSRVARPASSRLGVRRCWRIQVSTSWRPM